MKLRQILSFAFVSLLLTFMACDEGKLPNIKFKSGADYVSTDATVGLNEVVKIGIEASKAERKDPLKKFTVTRTFDGGTDETFIDEALSGSDGDAYSRDVEVTTRNQAGTEKYTFTVVNRDGLINQVSLTLTVAP